MKSIIIAHVILIAVCAWAELNGSVHQAQIVRSPIKYWIENVEFTQDEIQVDNEKDEKISNGTIQKSDDDSQTDRTGTKTRMEIHAGGEATASALVTRSGAKPSASVKINAGGGASKEWTKERMREIRKKQTVSKTDIDRGASVLEKTAGNLKLITTIIIQNISTNLTYAYNPKADSISGLYVASSVRGYSLSIQLPLPRPIELEPNGGWVRITIEVDIVKRTHKGLLYAWNERGVLKESLILAPDDGFRFTAGKQHWHVSGVRYSVAVNVDFDGDRGFGDMFPIYVSGKGLTCEMVLNKVSSELADDDKFRFGANGFLDRGLGLDFGTFTNDIDGVYAIMAKVNGTRRGRLAKDEILSSDYNRKSELRFIKIGTEELLSEYQRNPASYPKDVILDCLSCIASQVNSPTGSDKDLSNGAELAKAIRENNLYALFLTYMSDADRNEYLKSDEDKQSAMELTIEADNEEYFKKLRSLGWKNPSRTEFGFAAEKGSLNIVKWFLENAPENERPAVDGLVDGAEKDDIGERGKTPLFWAAKNGHLDVCKYLVSKGADINRKFYECEEQSGKERKYDELIGATYIPDVRIRNYITAQRDVLEFRNMWRPRMANFKHEITRNKVRSWVTAGVLPDSSNSDLGYNWNFLSWAVCLKDVSLVEFLIDKGADVNGEYAANPDDKRTALMLACEVGDTNLVDKLIKKRANLYAHQDDGMSAFHYAIKFKKYDCARMLLDKLDIAKCSKVKDDGQKLNLFQYVGKYCNDKDFCKKMKEMDVDAWIRMLEFWHRKGFRDCLDKCDLNEGEAKTILELSQTVQMADDLYERGFLQDYLESLSSEEERVLESSNPSMGQCFKFLELRQKAKKDDADSQYELGKCYARGKGVIKDGKRAFIWFKMAADKNHSEACREVAICYKEGFGTAMDKEKALQYGDKAIDLESKDEGIYK